MSNPYRKPDAWSQRAKDEGYAARSVYKLDEIDRRVRLFRRGQRVLDLGCAPGSWSQYAIERIGKEGTLVGVDLTPVSLPGGTFLEASILDIPADLLRGHLGGPADAVISDMAPLTMGARDADHFAQIELVRCAFERATELLKPGGVFVAKVFEGPDAKALELDVKKRFTETRRIRPEAVRANSREWFLVAIGRK